MRIFRRLFGQKSESQVSGKYVLGSDVMLQTRRAQAVDVQLANAIRRTCQEIPELVACYLLDARRPETGEMALIIATTLDDAARMDSVAEEFQTMLRQFPSEASKTYIMLSGKFARDYAGAEFYVRAAP
jgi:UTP-glucose-1-phosphate uridylyltransferase